MSQRARDDHDDDNRDESRSHSDSEMSRAERRRRRLRLRRLKRRGKNKGMEFPERRKDGTLTGGVKGNRGGGRKPSDFIRLCRGLSYRAMKMRVRRILRKPDHQHFIAALKLASAYGWGQPAQTMEVKGKLTLEQLVAGSFVPTKKRRKSS